MLSNELRIEKFLNEFFAIFETAQACDGLQNVWITIFFCW